MKIRTYQDRDAEGVIALWRADEPNPSSWNEPESVLLRKQAFQPDLLFVAEENDQIIGTTMAGYDGHRGWIYAVVVAPSHRRKGIASSLVAEAERTLHKIGCLKVNLQVRKGNDAAIELYESLGYGIEARVSMGKTLGS
ncbi:GNAT family acetyltransferase [Kiloniella laminariae]|uniref:GNAT family acetyltransferase n=1 Tax=Kiloniella laminariae TaxID=454162 RepID=A0ABT4LP48_9PROT|nr:GNAT family acetyltransferase [Kiloniella laminariae]MCZ4282857.1 GNAT family acetyltransferase [Kiloniella laminariae]